MTSGFFNFLSNNLQRANRAKRAKKARNGRDRSPLKPRRLTTETLEERQLLAVDVFNMSAAVDANSTNVIEISADQLSIDSIKQAIEAAAETPQDDVVMIAPGEIAFADATDEITINLDSSSCGSISFVVNSSDDSETLKIDAGGFARVFTVKSGDVYFEGLELVNGRGTFGGAIANGGVLTLENVTIEGNFATEAGGAIANKGELYVQNSTIAHNETEGNGAAIYEGDFAWDPTGGDETPEWLVIPDQVGSKGTTISVDLSQFINDGDWTYSFEIAETTSAILASAPTLNSGVLSFTFVGDDDYYGEDDYSAIPVTVTASNGTESATQSFSVSLAEQTSVTIAAVISGMTDDDIYDSYFKTIGSGRNKVTGYASNEIPSQTVVNPSAENLHVQVWFQDFASSKSGDDQTWDGGDYTILSATYRVHLENATFVDVAEDAGYFNTTFVYKATELGNGDYQFMIAYNKPSFGYENAMLFDVFYIQAINASKPVSVTITQDDVDLTTPTAVRLYSNDVFPSRYQTDAHAINVDPSQTLFVSSISNSTEPLSAVPGTPFETYMWNPIDRATVSYSGAVLDASNARTSATICAVVSNSLIVGNTGGGDGAIFVADGATLDVYNATIADNTAGGAAVNYAGSASSDVVVANSIVVNDNLAPATSGILAVGNLFNESGWNGNTEYQGGALFTDATNGDYALAVGSEAANVGDEAYALDVHGAALDVDLAGKPRFSATVDAGAYELQGEAPSVPAKVAITDYYASEKAPKLTWNAASSEFGVDGYKIYLVESTSNTVIATVSKNTRAYSKIAEVVDLEDFSSYVFGVAAFNAYGESDVATVTLETIVPPESPVDAVFGPYDSDANSATLTWSPVEHATGYVVETLDSATSQWIAADLADDTETSFVLTNLEDFESYSVRVAAYNEAGQSEWTVVDFTASAIPDAPSDVTVHFNHASKSATIAWSLSSGATGYYIYVQENNGVWQKIATMAPHSTAYIATDLSYYATYTYGVSAFNDLGESEKTVKTIYTGVVPAAPTSLTVVDADSYNGDGAATLTWDAVDGADRYDVSYTLDGTTTPLGSTTETSYAVSGLENFKDYVFSVVAVNDEGTSDAATVEFNTLIPPVANFSVEASDYDFENQEVVLSWSAVEYADGYRVEVLSGGNTWTSVDSTEDVEFTLTNLTDFANYSYRVVAYNAKGDGSTATVDFFTLAPPATPTDLVANYDADAASATLTWTAVDYADSYLVERKVDGTWTVVSSESDEPTYTATALEANRTHLFRVAAVNAAGASDYVEVVVDATAPEAPAAPSDFTVAAYSEESHRLTLQWTDNSDNETGFVMQYRRGDEDWKVAAELDANVTSRVANGLTPGQTYTFRIAAFNDYGSSEWVELVFDTPAADLPAAPTDLVFGEYDAAAKSIEMSWTDNSDDELGFKVEYSVDGGATWRASATVDADVTSRTATGLVEGRTYVFRVAAYNLSGTSEWATESVTIPSTTIEKPAAPSNIVFSNPQFTTTGAQVTMSWTDNSDNEDQFVVQFSYDNSSWRGAGSTDANVTTRVATGLVEGRTYYYRVAAYNAAGYSDWATGTYVVPSSTVVAPSDIVFGEYSNGTVPMSWTDNSDDEIYFLVQFSYDNENWRRAGTTEANVTERVAYNMTPNRTYYFRVAAYNGVAYSDWTYGEFHTPSGAPAAPGDITFDNYDASARTVQMTWADLSGDEIGFNVEYSVDGGATWRASGNTSADVNYRTATGLRPGVAYQFRVRSFNAYGASGWSYGDYAVPVSGDAPAAPTNFTFGEYDADAKTLAMSWTDNATNETGYKVQYSVDGGETWLAAGTYGADVTSRLATSVVAGRTYTFRVAAFNDAGNSAWLVSESYEVAASTLIPKAPSGLTFGEYDSANRSVEMSWTDNSNNEKGFRVQYSVDDGATWKDSAYLAADVTSRTATGVAAGRVYYFRVAAYNNYGYSDWETGVFSDVTTSEITAPTDLAFNYNMRKKTIDFAWAAVDGATSYNAQYTNSQVEGWYALTVSGTTATLANVIDGIAYDFRVQSVAEDGSLSQWTTATYDTGAASVVLDEFFDEAFDEDDLDLIADYFAEK